MESVAAPHLHSLPSPIGLEDALRRLAPVVLAWCRRLGGASIDADDASQEVLVVIAQRSAELVNLDALEPWAYTVTRNVVRRHRMRVWWRRWTGGVSSHTQDARRSAEATLLSAETSRCVDAVLECLPMAQREVLVLSLVEGRADTEVARLLGIPRNTVKSRLRLARGRFRTLVAADPRFAPLRSFLEEGPDAG